MKNFFYSRLAANNIRKNARNYIPYIIACTLTIIMFYSFLALGTNDGLKQMETGSRLLPDIMVLGIWVVGIFAVIFLFYTYSFLIKRRQKEFGLFNILGMEKKHISRIVALETLYVAVISLAAGLIIGILLNKLLYMLLLRMIDAKLTLEFYISIKPLIITVLFFGCTFFVIFLYSIRRIRLSNPVELLHSTKTGEKEPKTKIIMTILGILCLGGGYYISLTTENIQYAIVNFFGAVILVIVGTYLLFTVGSVTLLKVLKKNKKYYYKTNHFISVSSMIYRMKRNAVGLANICILSTMVLVMLSVTTTLMTGLENTLNKAYPNDVAVFANIGSDNNKEQINSLIEESVQETAEEHQLNISNISENYFLEIAFYYNDNGEFSEDGSFLLGDENLYLVEFISVSDYNRILSKEVELKSDEVLLFSDNTAICDDKEVTFYEKQYTVTDSSNTLPDNLTYDYIITNYTIVIVSDDTFEYLSHITSEYNSSTYSFSFDLNGTNEQKISFFNDLSDKIFDNTILRENGFSLLSKAATRTGLYEIYGGLLFIGIFLGILFTAAMVLIIYYKQTSEGYEDRERFEIMQKVGLDSHDIKKSIRSQILTVFFLPLIVAGIHIIFAYPIISQLVKMLVIANTKVLLFCTLTCFTAFALFYIIVYILTARTYYKLVTFK